MSVQRYYAPPESGPWKHPEGWWMKYADHARIVAEMEARWVEIARQVRMAAHQRGAQEAERQHAKALADMEQAHAAALANERLRLSYNNETLRSRAAAPRTLTADDARAAVVRLTEWSAYKHDQGFERAVDEAVIAIDSLIHDGEATPLDNMGLRDRDEVENRLSSIRSLMLARPPRTTADALRALADDIQGAAIDGEATP
jgi:hypothetical protein